MPVELDGFAKEEHFSKIEEADQFESYFLEDGSPLKQKMIEDKLAIGMNE